MNIKDQKEFPVDSAQLKEVRNFARGLFDQVPEFEDNREELVLALAEAAQNIVKHAYKDEPDSKDIMVVEISCKDNKLKIAFYDMGTPVDPEKVKHREIDNIKPGGLGTFFIQEIMDVVEFQDKKKKPWINHLVLTKQL